MLTINDPVTPVQSVYVNFAWEPRQLIKAFTVDGDTYPHKHQKSFNGKMEIEEISRPTDVRYEEYSSVINAPIEFDAIDSKTEGKPKVIPPEGVVILEYLWDFGDGTIGVGPVVTHEYLVNDPFVSVGLRVVDSRGNTYGARRYLNLLFSIQVGRVAEWEIVA